MHHFKNEKFLQLTLKPTGAVKLKKLTALSAITACLLFPVHLLSGEIRIYVAIRLCLRI